MAASDVTTQRVARPVYEHPWAVRFCHWANAMSVTVLAMSGLQIFAAFPAFGRKIPQQNLIDGIPEAIALGGWLGGALQWHFTFMWIFAGIGLLYLISQVLSGHWRTLVFMPRDLPGLWPMARHYLKLGPKPAATGQYNPLQKQAYTTVLLFGTLSVLSGLVMYKPVQLSALGWFFGGYHGARLIHFLAMCGLLAFVPGHLIMVLLHGWDNFASMVTGWKRYPEYTSRDRYDSASDVQARVSAGLSRAQSHSPVHRLQRPAQDRESQARAAGHLSCDARAGLEKESTELTTQ